MKIGEKLLELGKKIFSKRLKATQDDSGNYCWWFFYEPKKPKMFD